MRLTMTAGALAATLLLTGCGGGDDEEDQAVEPTPSPLSSGAVVDRINAQQARVATLAALRDIDPELTEDADKALNRAGNVCDVVAGGGDGVQAVRDRYDVDAATARRVLTVLEDTYCPAVAPSAEK